MQPGGSQRLPLKSYLYRVIGEYRFLLIVTLIQANAFTLSKVYSRNDFYCSLTSLPLRIFWRPEHYHIIIAVTTAMTPLPDK